MLKESTKVGWLFAATLMARFIAQNILYFFAEYLSNSSALVLNQLIILFPTLIYLIYSKKGLKESLRINRLELGNAVLIILFAFLIMPVMNCISALSLLISQNHIAASIDSTVKGGVITALFAIAVVPAVVEETVFRGAIYNNFREVNIKSAIFMSAFLFGLLHLNFNQFCYAFAMGVVMTLLIEATDTIIAPILVHFVINGYSTVIAYVTPKLVDYIIKNGGDQEVYSELLNHEITKDMIISNLPFYVISSIIGCILSFIVYRTIANNTNRWGKVKAIWCRSTIEGKEMQKEGILSVPLLASIVLCIFLIIINR